MARAIVNVPARAKRGQVIEIKALIEFTTIAADSGKLEFKWTGDNLFSASESAAITAE